MFPINLLLNKKPSKFASSFFLISCAFRNKKVSANNTIQIHFIDTSKLYTEIELFLITFIHNEFFLMKIAQACFPIK